MFLKSMGSSLGKMSLPGTHYLYPSTLFAARNATEVTTVLGSCVAVCLFDPVSKTGGINHFMLPVWEGEGLASPKYGDIAIEKLLQKMLSLGAKRSNMQAKVFGGADSRRATNVFKIGQRNCEIALSVLSGLNIPVVSSHLGGELPRKLIFRTLTSEVLLKVLSKEISNSALP